MSKLIKKTISCVFILLTLGLLITCDDPTNPFSNPFSNNLGEKVVVEPPTIYVISPANNSFLVKNTDGTVTVTGYAKAYIKVERVEWKVFENPMYKQEETPWSTEGVVSGEGSSIKEWNWTFTFDPSQFNSGRDGYFNMQFRVWDSAAVKETIKYIFKIKTKPSEINMTNPSAEMIISDEKEGNPSRINHGGEILGQVIDVKGLRPGYPQIQIWPKGQDPEALVDDSQWGWASLFLSGYDDIEKETATGPAGPGKYADRSTMRVVNSASFSVRLAKYTINKKSEDVREIQYDYSTGKHVPFDPGNEYYFRIRTSDVLPDPANGEKPDINDLNGLKGFFPPKWFGDPDKTDDAFYYRLDTDANPDPQPSATNPIKPVRIVIFSSNARPVIEIDNEDLTNTTLTTQGYDTSIKDISGNTITDRNKLLSDIRNMPNPYITSASSRKIATGNAGDFRLRLKIIQPNMFEKVKLEYQLGSNGVPVEINWDPVTSPGIASPDLSYGAIVDSSDPQGTSKGLIFTYNSKPAIFTSNTDQYILTVTVIAKDKSETKANYMVTMDGKNPRVRIDSIKGASAPPTGSAASFTETNVEGLLNSTPYTVNGNIQVLLGERTDESGIMPYRGNGVKSDGVVPPVNIDDMYGYPMVKWILEEVDPASQGTPVTTSPGTVLAALKAFKTTPNRNTLEFFNKIDDWTRVPLSSPSPLLPQVTSTIHASGWVRRGDPNALKAEDRAHNFKINTNGFADGTNLWLYVIAQDQAQNLGFIVQKIYVDNSKDKPVINPSPLREQNAGGTTIDDENNLDVGMTDPNSPIYTGGNWSSTANPSRRNILQKGDDIQLDFYDDDGIDIDNGGISIKLTVLDPVSDITAKETDGITIKKSVTISYETLRDEVFKVGPKNSSNDPNRVRKQWIAPLTQEVMAKALSVLYSSSSADMKEGMYKIEFTVKDDKNSKVAIVRSDIGIPDGATPIVDGDTPDTETVTKTYYFAVYNINTPPAIEIESPKVNQMVSEKIPIYGTVTSRFKMQNIWITFTPDIITYNTNTSVSSAPEKLTLYADAVYSTPHTDASDTAGIYTYYWSTDSWRSDGVDFNPTVVQSAFGNQPRSFTVDAYDRLGNKGSKELTVQIDSNPPDLVLIDFNHNRPYEKTQFVYGKVSFTVTASDDNGMYDGKDGVDIGHSGIKWWVFTPGQMTALAGKDPSWTDSPTKYSVWSGGNPKPATAPDFWEAGGDFLFAQNNGGRYIGIIDTRWLPQGEYYLCVLARDNAGNYSSKYETFTVDQSKDLPTIDTNSFTPMLDSVIDPTTLVISGAVSDADLFDPKKLDAVISSLSPPSNQGYVQIRFPKIDSTGNATTNPNYGKPLVSGAPSTNDWGDWIYIEINSDTYSASKGGIDPSGAIVYKYTPPSGTAEEKYLKDDGIKYYQIRVTDEPVEGVDKKNWGKNPDSLMSNNPGYVAHNAVTRIFPDNDTGYKFIVDASDPEIVFDKFDPTPNPAPPPNPLPHPNYSSERPTYSSWELLRDALSGTVVEYKLSTLALTWRGKGDAIITKFILSNPDDPNPAGVYPWNLGAKKLSDTETRPPDISAADAADLKKFFDAADQGLQIISFEATDMVGKMSRVSWIFYKDTQGPEISFNSIKRAIKRSSIPADPSPALTFPSLGANPWPYDFRNGEGWRDDANNLWKAFRSSYGVDDWPSEYAFLKAGDIVGKLIAENKDYNAPSTVIGDPEDKKVSNPQNYNPPVILGSFSDEYSLITKPVTANTETFFYYRFKRKNGDVIPIPTVLDASLTAVLIPPGTVYDPVPTEMNWIKKKIERISVDGDKSADWEIILDSANGFNGSDGENWVDICVEDTAGNISEIFNVSFLLDRTPPLLGSYNTAGTLQPGEFKVASVTGYSGSDPTLPALLDVEKRVFSGLSSSNPTPAFTISGRVNDYNLNKLTITIGQDGGISEYKVEASVDIDLFKSSANPPTGSGTGVTPIADKVNNASETPAQHRLTLTGPYKAGTNDAYTFDDTGTPEWEWTLAVLEKDVNGLRTAAGAANIDSARRYIRVTATDKAGKRAGPIDWSFYLDTKKPIIEFTDPEPNIKSSFENEKFVLHGMVSDDTRIKDVQYMVGKWDYTANGNLGAWSWYNGSAWCWWNAAADSGNGAWFYYNNVSNTWVQATVLPKINSPADWPSVFASGTSPARQTSMNWSINQETLNNAGTGVFPQDLFKQEGKYRLDLYVTDFSLGNGNPHNTMLVKDDDFKDEGTLGGSPNTYNPGTGAGNASGRAFHVDKDDPKLEWGWANDPDDTQNRTYFRNEDNGQVNFKFTAGDGNTIKHWKAEISDSNGSLYLSTVNTGIKWQAGTKEVVTSSVVPIPPVTFSTAVIDDQKLILTPYMTTNGIADTADRNNALDKVSGNSLPTYTITITVWDGADRSNRITKQFTLDNMPPEFVQDKFQPTGFDLAENTTWDAVTGRMNIRGNTTDNSNQIKSVSYYVVNKTDVFPSGSPGSPGLNGTAFPTPKQITDAKLWRYSGGTTNTANAPDIKASDGTTLIEIDQGTFAWKIMVPQTSQFFTDNSAKNYVQLRKTGGIGIDGSTNNTADPYKDVTSISENSAPLASPTPSVPALTFPDLSKDPTKFPLGDKTIYGGEEVGLITVYVRAEDAAGNVAYDVLKYWIWPEGDRPIVTSINNPDYSKSEVERYLNGTIRLSGMAKDNERVKNVWFRVLPSTNGVPTGAPYELTIPEWDDEWNAIPGKTQDPVNDITTIFTDGGYIGARRLDDPLPAVLNPPPNPINGGWYRANGGNSREVSWWAYINTNGELDPKDGEPKKEFTVQVRAQDVTFDDKNDRWKDYGEKITTGPNPKPGDYRGFASIPVSVTAWVVADAPTFIYPLIAPVASETAEAAELVPAGTKYWDTVDNISIRNRSSYKVTVTHKIGLGSIRWSPTQWYKDQSATATDTGVFRAYPGLDTFNLLAVQTIGSDTYTPVTSSVWLNLAGNAYKVGTTAQAQTALSNKETAMAVRVEPKGTAIDGVYKEYDVFVDINADLLLAKMLADDPKYGDFVLDAQGNKVPLPGREGQTVDSVRYPVYLSASDISKATPLTSRGDALLPIDQNPPTAQYTLNRRPAGTAATIGGEAGDEGPVRGIARVVLWFQRYKKPAVEGDFISDGDFISWHENYGPNNTFIDSPGPLDPNVPEWWKNVTLPSKVRKPAIGPENSGSGGDSAIVIDTNSPLAGKPRWGHSLPTGFADGGMGKHWYVEINSLGMKSGPVDLHYVVIDKAGNYRYYKERLVIMNGVAVIDRVKLGTDIRDNTGVWTNNIGGDNGKTGANLTASPLLDQIRDKVPLVTDDNDVKKGISDWVPSSALGVNNIVDFNVRNNLMALRVETTAPPLDKNRNFRLEYVSGAKLLANTSMADKTLAENIKAGRVYIINDPGEGNTAVRWGSIGAQGDGPWQRGYAFIAAVDGRERDEKGEFVEKISGIGSVWELNSAYYNAAGNRTVPSKLNLPDVTYATVGDSNAKGAEFMYGNSAFGTVAGGENATIVDYANFGAKGSISGNTLTISDHRVNEINRSYTRTGGGTSLDGTWTASGGYSIVFNGSVYSFRVNGAITHSGNISVSGSTITFDPDAYPAPAGVNPITEAGNSMFILRVFDGDEEDLFGDFTILRVRVNNNDRTPPFAQLYDINPKTEGQDRQNIAGGSETVEQRRSLSPMFIGEEGTNSNRTKGGLWNIAPKFGDVEKPGHIEPMSRTTGFGSAQTGNMYTTVQPGESAARNHSLSSAQMGGAATKDDATMQKPWADPEGFLARDTVSGRVVLRGYAEDDQRVHQIALEIGGTEVVILDFQPNADSGAGAGTTGNTASFESPKTGLLYVPDAQFENGNRNNKPKVYFTDTIDAYRHRVEWAYIWDTETIPGGNNVVGNDINVRVIAYNRNPTNNTRKTASDNTPSPGTAHTNVGSLTRPNTSPENPGFPIGLNKYNSINFNLRPYITGFLRNQTLFSHNERSRQGRYMFYREEVAVVKGFNLNTSAGNATSSMTINGVAVTGLGNVGTPSDFATQAVTAAMIGNRQRYRQFTVPNNTTTGSGLVIYSFNQPAINTSNERGIETTNRVAENNEPATAPATARPNYIQPWNIEYSPGIDGSQLWDDFIQVHIWSGGNASGTDQGVFPKGTNLEVFDPAMSIDPKTGTLWSSHNEGGGGGANGNSFNTGSTKVGNNSGEGSFVSASFIDPIINSDIYISPRRSGATVNENSTTGGNNFTVWTAYSIIGRSGTTGSWRDYGGVYVSGPQGANASLSQGQGLSGTTNNGFAGAGSLNARSQYLVESTGYNAGTNTNVDVNWPPGNVDLNSPSRNQFKTPHIVTWYGRGTNTGDTGTDVEHIHVSYYDTKDKSLKYRYNRRGGPGNMAADMGGNANNAMNSNNMPYAWTNLDGGLDLDDQNAFNANSNGNWANGTGGGWYTTPFSNFTAAIGQNGRIVNWNTENRRSAETNNQTDNATNKSKWIDAGEYNSIALTSNGYPVIAYFDKTNQKLKMAISNATVPIAASRWTIIENVIPTTGTFSAYAYGTGEYVSMKIDTTVTPNVVHIAAMNGASKNLVYIKGELRYSAGANPTPTYTTTAVQIVDSVGSVGRWCSLSLDSNGNPWISYQDEGYQGSRDGVKLAYYNDISYYKGSSADANKRAGADKTQWIDADLYNNNISGWEAMHIPTRSRVENARVGMENYPTRNYDKERDGARTTATKFWLGAVGFLGEGLFRAAYYVE
jgi:hypothetical protein